MFMPGDRPPVSASGLPGSDDLTQYAQKFGERKEVSPSVFRRVLDFSQYPYYPDRHCEVKDIPGIIPYKKLVCSEMWMINMVCNGLTYSVPEAKELS